MLSKYLFRARLYSWPLSVVLHDRFQFRRQSTGRGGVGGSRNYSVRFSGENYSQILNMRFICLAYLGGGPNGEGSRGVRPNVTSGRVTEEHVEQRVLNGGRSFLVEKHVPSKGGVAADK